MRRENNINKALIASIAFVGILIISLIGFIVSKTSKKSNENQFAGEMSSLNKMLSESESASTKIGKSVDDVKNDEEFETAELVENNENNNNSGSNKVNNKKDKESNNIANSKTIEKKSSVSETQKTENNKTSQSSQNESETKSKNELDNSKNKTTTSETGKNKNTVQTNATVEKNEDKKNTITLEMPVKGEIIREFAKDSLVYSNTLQEWITHTGIDIKADKTSVVKAAEDGTVAAIKNDPRYGLTVIINHDNGFQTVYSNLLTAEFVVKGEKVKKGQSIGTVGNSGAFEISDDYHLHFELIRNNEYLDPIIYMSAE